MYNGTCTYINTTLGTKNRWSLQTGGSYTEVFTVEELTFGYSNNGHCMVTWERLCLFRGDAIV